jgi:DNA polymerase-3 subunit gamma/tau
VLGAADADLVFGAVDAVAAGDVPQALRAAAALADSGRDLGRFFGDLEAHARALMVVQALGEVPAEIRVTPEQDERLAAQARAVGPADVVRLLELIAAALRALKDGADARTQLELALVKAAEPGHDPSTKALLTRIERLEARLAGAATPSAPASRAPEEPATAAGRTRAEATPTVTAIAVVEPEAPAAGFSPDAFDQVWPAILQTLEEDSPRTAELLRQATPLEVTSDGLTLAWPRSAAFYKRQAEDPAKRELIARCIRTITGASLRLVYELRADEEFEFKAEATLSDEELVDRFKHEFSAVEEPSEES